MRRMIDLMILLLAVGTMAGVWSIYRAQTQQQEAEASVRQALTRMLSHAEDQRAMSVLTSDVPHYPAYLSPLAFIEPLPQHALLGPSHAWLDIAAPDDRLDHPPDPVVTGREQAAFWYNPASGVVRARVPEQKTQAATLALYNRLNGTALKELTRDVDPARQPLSLAAVTAQRSP